jgi:hypothetical protein
MYFNFNDATRRTICPIRKCKNGDIRFEVLAGVIILFRVTEIKGAQKQALPVLPNKAIPIYSTMVQVFIQKITRRDG